MDSQTKGFRGRTSCLNKELLNDRMVWIGRDCKELGLVAVLLEQMTGQKTSRGPFQHCLLCFFLIRPACARNGGGLLSSPNSCHSPWPGAAHSCRKPEAGWGVWSHASQLFLHVGGNRQLQDRLMGASQEKPGSHSDPAGPQLRQSVAVA